MEYIFPITKQRRCFLFSYIFFYVFIQVSFNLKASRNVFMNEKVRGIKKDGQGQSNQNDAHVSIVYLIKKTNTHINNIIIIKKK